MRAVAATIAGAYALLVMTVMLPWDAAECAAADCVTSATDGEIFSMWPTIATLAVSTLILVTILRGVLGMRSTRDPEAGAVLAALGQTRGTAVKDGARDGLRDGAIAGGAAFVIVGAFHVGMLVGTGLNPITTGAELWLGRAILAVAVVGAVVLAHVHTAASRPRTPVDALTADVREEPAARPSLRRRAQIAGGGLVAAGGFIAGLAFAERDTPAWEVSHYSTNAAGIAMIVAWAGALALGLWVAVPWLRARRGAVIGAAARVVARDGRVAAVLGAYAGDRSRASTRVVTVLAALGFLIVAVPSQVPYPSLNDSLVRTVWVDGDVDADALEDAYRAIDGVGHVTQVQAIMLDEASFHSFVYAVSPSALRGRDDELADALERHPRSVATDLVNGNVPMELLAAQEFDVDGIIPIASCCDTFVNGDHVELESPKPGFLIYATDEADVDATHRAISHVTSGAAGTTGMGMGTSSNGGDADVPLWNTVVNVALFGAVFLLPLVLIAVGAVRRRRHDDATLTALGATARTMRVAIAAEMAVVSAYALAAGMVGGAATRVLMTALQQGRLSLRSVEVDSAFMTGVQSVPWTAMAIVGIGAVAVMTIAAFATAWAAGRRAGRAETPAGPSPSGRQPVPLP
ncbi:MAG: FtsX-like permease family protein [Demequina sp.]